MSLAVYVTFEPIPLLSKKLLLFYNIDNSILFQLPERKTRIFASSAADIVSENLPSKGYIFPVFPFHSPVQIRAKIVDSMLFELSNEHVNRYTFPVSSVTDSSCEGFNLIFLVLLFDIRKNSSHRSCLEIKKYDIWEQVMN